MTCKLGAKRQTDGSEMDCWLRGECEIVSEDLAAPPRGKLE